jgi:para-aminobenzoate synthetase component I
LFSSYKVKYCKWANPENIANNINKLYKQFAFLYSSKADDKGKYYSYIAFDVAKEIISDKMHNLSDIDNEQWFGYFGYELKHCLEELPKDIISYIETPNLYMTKYNNIILFDHSEMVIKYYYRDIFQNDLLDEKIEEQHSSANKINNFSSNMTREYYLQSVNSIKQKIIEGDIYQANLTRKFFGEFENNISGLDMFLNLSQISPSNYSCYFKYPEFEIISSSPERFLQIDNDHNVSTKPIKGTAKSSDCDIENEQIKKNLFNSIKDRSENLMIVDLMRNDFAKTCQTGSIEVIDLFKIESYKNLHHMVTQIIGKLDNDKNNIDLLKGCFPPGSMTGTPKIKAMIECSVLEKWKRGVYSGCIGRFSKNKSVDLSVVIRTLLISGKKFEFQVGGAIVIDSDPLLELEETITKAKAMALAIGINIDKIRNI